MGETVEVSSRLHSRVSTDVGVFRKKRSGARHFGLMSVGFGEY